MDQVETSKISSRNAKVALVLIAISSATYLVTVSLLVPHNSPIMTVGWKASNLSSSTLTPSSIGKVAETFTSTGELLTISGNVSQLRKNYFYGVTFQTGQDVNVSQFYFFQVSVKTNSIYLAAMLGVLLDSGSNVTVLQKTYDDQQWHSEIMDMRIFSIPPYVSVAGLFMGFQLVTTSIPPPNVEFAQPAFEKISPTPG